VQVIICRGLPASGKTTWAKAEQLKYKGHLKRLNKDDLRAMLDGGVYSPANELVIKSMIKKLIIFFVDSGKRVILDDTNLAISSYDELVTFLDYSEISYEVKLFKVPVATCVERNSKREFPVPNVAIFKMNKVMETLYDE